MNDQTGDFIERIAILSLVAALGYACFVAISPFIVPFLWAAILVLSTWPYFVWLTGRLAGRKVTAAVLMTLLLILILSLPLILVIEDVTSKLPSATSLAGQIEAIRFDQPPGWLREIPVIGEPVDAAWRSGRYRDWLDGPRLQAVAATLGRWLLHQSAHLALTALHLILAPIMAGLLYVHGERTAAILERLALRLGGERLRKILRTAAVTVRGVALGVLGTALVQALLCALGFLIVGVPGATLLGLLCFLLATLHLGTPLVWVPVAIWLAQRGEEASAIFIVAWGILIILLDNFLKPYLIGRSSALPLILIFLGVVGGLVAWGILGIFLGTTLLAVAHSLVLDWLDRPGTAATGPRPGASTPPE